MWTAVSLADFPPPAGRTTRVTCASSLLCTPYGDGQGKHNGDMEGSNNVLGMRDISSDTTF